MMVCEVGMSKKLGPVSYGEREDSIFLGREFAQHRPDYSEKTAIDIDEEINRTTTIASVSGQTMGPPAEKA